MLLADALIDYPYLKVLNLSMNFIHDLGASFFVDCICDNLYPAIEKITLLNNQCTERLKKFAKIHAPVIIL